MSTHLRLDGQVAIVTGAGRGLGRAYALALAVRGARVLVNDLGGTATGTGSSPEPAEAVAAEVRAAGGEAIADSTDVSVLEGGAAVVDAALEAFGRVDVIVTNAGILLDRKPFADTTFADLELTWRIHVGGTYNVLHAAWPHLVAQRSGRIITTSSCAGLYGEEGSPEYSSAKGAIIGLTRALALEGAAHGVAVNAIAPAAWTRMVAAAEFDDEAIVALKPLLDPALVAPTVVWLAHDSCRLTGQIIAAGAGRTAAVQVAEPVGAWAATPEELARSTDAVRSGDDLVSHDSALDFVGWLAAQAGARSGALWSRLRP